MFAKSKTGWVGFDIGATGVKAAQIVRADGEYRLRSAAIVPRAERWDAALLAEKEPKSSADEVSTAASLCERLAGASAAALLPTALYDLVQLELPPSKRAVSEADLLRAVEAETQRPMRDRVLDSWPVGKQSGKLNVVTAPRAWSDQTSADVADAGWNCRAIDALPWALARAVRLLQSAEQTPTLTALDWGYGKSTMVLIHEHAPVLTRSLKDCGLQHAIDAVAQGLRLERLEAEQLLQRYGLALGGSHDDSVRVISDLVEPLLNRLAQEIRRTLDYWRGAARGLSPQAIYLFGGGGAIAGVDRRITAALELRAESWRLPAETESEQALLPPPCLFGAAAGLSAAAWETL